jgi:hypothetical protein
MPKIPRDAPQDDEAPPKKKLREESSSVARGTPNVLRTSIRAEGHYAFVSRREGSREGPWYVLAECVDQQWMDGIWRELQQTPAGQRLVARLQGQPSKALTSEPLFNECWEWFMDRFWQPGKTPPVLSSLEFTLSEDDPWRVEAGRWYDAQLIPAGTLGNAVTSLHTVLLREQPFREPPQQRQLANFLEVQEVRPNGGIPQAALHVLHTLQDESDSSTQGDADSVMEEDEPMTERTAETGPSAPVRLGQAVSRWLAERVERFQETVRDFWPPGGPGAGLAFAGAPGLLGGLSPRTPWRLHAPAGPRATAPHQYCGAPGDGNGGQVPNPMPGGHVGVFNIGQGNCNAIYDNAGTILAYFDLGAPTALNNASWPAAGFAPCVCDRPVIILSHTDQDHYELGRTTAATHALTWIVPKGNGQTYGGVFGGLVASIRAAGGRLIGWSHTAPAGTMTFPWGWVERGTLAERNGGGLVAFVCVREDPAVVRARAALAALPGQLPGAPVVNTQLFAGPVAAALAAQYVGLAPADAALAAVRAVTAVLQGAVGPVNVTAAVNNGGGGLGIGVAVFGAVLPDGIPAAAAAAAIAAHGAGAAPGAVGHGARITAVQGGLNALQVAVLERVTAPIDPGPLGAGMTVDVSAPAVRARLALLQVPLEIAGAMVVPPVNTRLHAEVVAAALATSSGPGLTAIDAARAALRAVIAELNAPGGGVGGRVAIVNGGGVYAGINALGGGALVAHEAGNTVAAAIASVAAGNALTAVGAQARATAAAAAFVAALQVPDRANMIRTAGEPTNFQLTPGRALFSAGERYVLLNGDADYDFIGSLAPAAPGAALPVVVGMTAVHHGAIIVDERGTFLEGRRIPWAPGTAASGVPAVAAAHPANSLAAAITRVTNHVAGAPVANLKTRVCHAGAAAAAALYATGADYQIAGDAASQGLLIGGAWQNLAQGVAAAVLDTLLAPPEAGEVAIAAVLGTATRVNTANAHQFAQAASAARVRLRGPANPFVVVTGLLVECIAKTGNPLAAAALAALPAEVLGGAPANTATLAAPVAADLALRAGATLTAQTVARAAVRATIAVLNGAVGAPAVVAVINGAGALAGANVLVGALTAARATSTAEAAIAVVQAGAARVQEGGLAVAQVAPNTPGVMNVSLVACNVAAALATSVAGIPAVDAARAAVRAALVLQSPWLYGLAGMRADLLQAEVALVVNGGGGPGGGAANLVVGMAVLGAALAAPVAAAVARAAIGTDSVGGATTVQAHQYRGLAAATGLNGSRCKVIEDAVAAVAPALATSLVSVPTLALGAAVALNDVNVENTTVQGSTFRMDGFAAAVPDNQGTLRPIIARLARAARGAASTAVAMGPPVVNAELDAACVSLGTVLPGGALANLRANVSAVMALPVVAPGGAVATLQDVAREAAFLAMIGEAERASGIAASRIQAGIEAVGHNTVAAATAASLVPAGPSPGRIAYSYGVMPGNVHCHAASTLGDLGHPHPLAVAEYEARGWTVRRNTPLNANHAGRQGDAAGAHLRGHVSLGWDHVNDQNRAAGAVNVGACGACGQVALNR